MNESFPLPEGLWLLNVSGEHIIEGNMVHAAETCNSWLDVGENYAAYAFGYYVKNQYDSLDQAIDPYNGYAKVDNLSLRFGPMTQYYLLTKIPQNAVFVVHATNGHYSLIEWNGRKGCSYTSSIGVAQIYR